MGVNVARYKMIAFGVSCFFTGLAGALLAHFLQAFNYEAFLILISIQLVADGDGGRSRLHPRGVLRCHRHRHCCLL